VVFRLIVIILAFTRFFIKEGNNENTEINFPLIWLKNETAYGEQEPTPRRGRNTNGGSVNGGNSGRNLPEAIVDAGNMFNAQERVIANRGRE
jgi:hypothetical protein